MPSIIEHYRRQFAHLRTDSSAARWTEATRNRAPHKPFLLLALMDLVAQGVIAGNLIEFNAELTDAFELYWSKVLGNEKAGNPLLPFTHLQSDKFWHLIPMPGMEQALDAVRHVRSRSQLQQLVLGARLDDELFTILLDEKERDDLRRVLIETYFAPEQRAVVVDVGQIAAKAFEYSRELLARAGERFKLHEAPEVDEHYYAASRSIAFRRIVVASYDRACAMCGIRIVTPEGRTAVAAAHIVPWSVSHNDDPRNGMALCGLHHWTFDQGITSIDRNYHIAVSSIIPQDDTAAGLLLSLAKQPLYRPEDYERWPAEEALTWHRTHVFRT